MKRVLALAGAVFLIAAAIVVRAVIVDDGDESVGTDGGDDGDLVVACIPELREACEAIRGPRELLIQDPGETIAGLAAGEEIDAWVTLDPWPEMAEIIERQQFFGDVQRIAGSSLAVLVRTTELPVECATPVTWPCLVDALGDRVALPDAESALGRLVLGHVAEEFLPGVAANDFGEPEFARRLDSLESIADPLEDIRVGLPEPDATGTATAQLRRIGARIDGFTTSPGGSPASVAVVVAGRRADRIADEPGFTEALRDLGWDLDTDAATQGLPNAGVLVALAEVAP